MMDSVQPQWQKYPLPEQRSRSMKHPSTLDQMLLLLRKYAFLCGVALSLIVTLACCHAWTAHRPFHPDSFTPANDPSMRALVEECHIARNTIAVSGWIHSDVWPGDEATLILTVGDGEKEFSIPYRLQERPDIARTFHTEANAFHNRYGFAGTARKPAGMTPGATLHLNIISGHSLYRISHVCRS